MQYGGKSKAKAKAEEKEKEKARKAKAKVKARAKTKARAKEKAKTAKEKESLSHHTEALHIPGKEVHRAVQIKLALYAENVDMDHLHVGKIHMPWSMHF